MTCLVMCVHGFHKMSTSLTILLFTSLFALGEHHPTNLSFAAFLCNDFNYLLHIARYFSY